MGQRTHVANHEHGLWRAVVACVAAFLVFLTLVSPLPAAGSGPAFNEPGAMIMDAIDFNGSPLDPPQHDGNFLEHLQEHCHQAVWPDQKTVIALRVVSAKKYLPYADRQLGSGPAAVPFKPPRA